MKNIAVIGGGDSSEYIIAVQSAAQIRNNFIDNSVYNTFLVSITKKEWVVIIDENNHLPIDKNDFSFKFNGQKIKFDFAYITIHGTPGENGLLQGYFELLDISYSTCDVFTSALSFNKNACKLFLKEYEIPMAKAVLVKQELKQTPEDIVGITGIPCFVKPNNCGSSFGVSKVLKTEELIPAIEKALKEDSMGEVIIEQFIAGTEVSCGIIKTKQNTYVLPITEIVSKTDFFDFEAKYTTGMSDEITPARISEEVKQKLNAYCSEIYDVLACRGIVRIDFIISEGQPHFIEINTTPGMSKNSIIPQQIRAAGLDIKQVFGEVIEDLM